MSNDIGRLTTVPPAVRALAIAAALFLATGCAGHTGPPPAAPVQDPGAAMEAQLRRHVHALAADIGPRDWTNVPAANRAARYIEAEMRDIGAGVVTVQPYDARGATHYNVCIEIPGTRRPAEIVVVGAHYDTADKSPGADDNASGVAGVLALARRLAADPAQRTVRFVAFGTEEPPNIRTPNMGSYHFAGMCRRRGGNTDLAAAGDDIVAMISLEMIGYYSDDPGSQKIPPGLNFPDVGNYLVFVGDTSTVARLRRARELFTAHSGVPAQTWAAPRLLPGVNSSDQWSFWMWNYPGIMVTDTARWRNPNYHQPTDTPDTLDYPRMTRALEGLEAVIRDWARYDVNPTPPTP